MMSWWNSAEYERTFLKITLEIAAVRYDHGAVIQQGPCRLLHLRSPSVKRRTDGGSRLRDVVSFSLQTFKWMTLYLHFWPKESYTQEMLVDVSSSAQMWGFGEAYLFPQAFLICTHWGLNLSVQKPLMAIYGGKEYMW